MARMTIYVSDDLKRRIRKVREAVNWSALACEAFERKLGELAQQKERKTMSDVVQRLRASALKGETEPQAKGYEAGYEWAKARAEAHELKRLSRVLEDPERDSAFLIGDRSNAYSGAELFAFTIDPEHDGDRGFANGFWEGVGHDELPEDEFVQAFAGGAAQLWGEVEDQL